MEQLEAEEFCTQVQAKLHENNSPLRAEVRSASFLKQHGIIRYYVQVIDVDGRDVAIFPESALEELGDLMPRGCDAGQFALLTAGYHAGWSQAYDAGYEAGHDNSTNKSWSQLHP